MISESILRISDAVYLNAVPFPHKSLHVSMIISGKTILSIGTNSDKTHPLIRAHGYPEYAAMHSEVNAWAKLNAYLRRDSNLTLVNARYSRTGKLGMSKPCKYCLPFVTELFTEIWYTDSTGQLIKLNKEYYNE